MSKSLFKNLVEAFCNINNNNQFFLTSCSKQQFNKSSEFATWKSIGQGAGGILVDFVCHPTNPNIVWVVSDLTGIFKSIDGGVRIISTTKYVILPLIPN